jgi:hypothetical protein
VSPHSNKVQRTSYSRASYVSKRSATAPTASHRCAIVLVDISIMRAYTRAEPTGPWQQLLREAQFESRQKVQDQEYEATQRPVSPSSARPSSIRGYGAWILRALRDNLRTAIAVSNTVSAIPATPASSYSGHYIVLVGYEAATDEFVYRDPASSSACCLVTAHGLERARRAVGTDEDIIFVDARRSCGL